VPPSFSADPGKDRQPGWAGFHPLTQRKMPLITKPLTSEIVVQSSKSSQGQNLGKVQNHPKSWKHLRIQEIKLKLKLPCVNPVTLVLVFVDIPVGKFNSSHMSEYNLSRRLCVLLANDLLRVVDWINGTLLAEKSGQLMKLAEKCHTPQRHAANCCRSV